MKAKELASFLKKYALDRPAQDSDASKQEETEKPDAEAEDGEDPKDKAVPQVSCMCPLPCFLALLPWAYRSSANDAEAGVIKQLQRVVGSSKASWQKVQSLR